MERFGIDEIQFYSLPREVRARMVARCWIDSFLSVVQMYDARPKGK